MDNAVVLVGVPKRLRMIVKKNQKNPSIFVNLVMLRRQPAFDGNLLPLLPIWLIDASIYRMWKVLKLFGWSSFEIGAA